LLVKFSEYIALESYSYTELFIGVTDPTRVGVVYGTDGVGVGVGVGLGVGLGLGVGVGLGVGSEGTGTGVGGVLPPGLFAPPPPPPPPAQADNRKIVDTAMAIAVLLNLLDLRIFAPKFTICYYYSVSLFLSQTARCGFFTTEC
jgi:hypothetical protein